MFLQTHTGDLTLNSNVTCDLLSEGACINIILDDITLDCNGYSIIGPGDDIGTGIFVFGNNFIIKNCNVESFFIGIDDPFSTSTTVESSTLSNNDIGINQFGGPLTLENVLAENNRVGLKLLTGEEEVAIDNAYFCNNSDQDINVDDPFVEETCPGVEATGQIFASTFGSDCSIEDAINESLEENEFDPIVSCTDLVAQQSLLSAGL